MGGEDGGIFGALLDRYLNSLRGELVMFGVILGIWVLVVLIALVMVVWDTLRARRNNAASSSAPVEEKERVDAAPLMSEKSRT